MKRKLSSDLIDLSKKVRASIISMSFSAQSAHMGGALSSVEIVVSLYYAVMNIFPKDAYNDNRDRFILSKAHDAKVLYAVLAEKGFFDKDFLKGYEKNDGRLPGHTVRHSVEGVEASAGSLGHGLSIATGVALAGKIDNKLFRVYTLLSDGECDEGSTWEAALFANQHKLNNLCVIIDYNKLQGYGYTNKVLDLEPFSKKWIAFGWDVVEVDGHNFEQLINVLQFSAKKRKKPLCVIAHTIKGLGGPKQYINQIASQYKPPTEEEFKTLTSNSI